MFKIGRDIIFVSIDIVYTMCHNINMNAKYQIFKIKNKKFVVKLDYNPLIQDYEYHMYIRHLVTPQEAIAAYFSKTYEEYNENYDRYEAYSEKYDITVFYTFLKDENILLITAFRQGGNDEKYS